MNALTLLDRFTYVAGAGGGSFNTPWVAFPSEAKNAEMWVDTKVHETGTVTVTLESSMDTTQEEQVAQDNATAAGNNITAITSELGPLVRLVVSSTGSAAAATISVHLVPKQD